ncbi:hypothetical protein K439DRAFT_1617859 [Ramaria rubella]|nr:hypothetical protein K439DRAFT_1617859 [Ramaria rubella]
MIFLQDIYSPIDKLLEIAMATPAPETGSFQKFVQHRGREARVRVSGGKENCAVRLGPDGTTHKLESKVGGQVILCAGSVESAAILLRSNVNLAAMGGLGAHRNQVFQGKLPLWPDFPHGPFLPARFSSSEISSEVNPRSPRFNLENKIKRNSGKETVVTIRRRFDADLPNNKKDIGGRQTCYLNCGESVEMFCPGKNPEESGT